VGLSFRLALGHATFDVRFRFRMMVGLGEYDAVQGGIEAPVSASI
jgi:hypothetical protein